MKFVDGNPGASVVFVLFNSGGNIGGNVPENAVCHSHKHILVACSQPLLIWKLEKGLVQNVVFSVTGVRCPVFGVVETTCTPNVTVQCNGSPLGSFKSWVKSKKSEIYVHTYIRI